MSWPAAVPYRLFTQFLSHAVPAVAGIQRIVQKDDPTDDGVDDFADGFQRLEAFWEFERDYGPMENSYWNHFRGHYPTIPDPIGRYAEASYHELARRIVLDTFMRISVREVCEAIAKRPGDPSAEWDSRAVRSSWEELQSRLSAVPEFHGDRLAAMIADEAVRAARADEASIADPEADGEFVSASPLAEEATGPVPPDAFRWDGKLHRGLAPTAWRLVHELWKADENSREIDSLAEPVWRDHAIGPDENQVAEVRKTSNAFFTACGLPFRVSKKAAYLTLKPEAQR